MDPIWPADRPLMRPSWLSVDEMAEKILFITGHLAESRLKAVLESMDPEFEWRVLDIGVKVAALMTEDIILRRLSDAGGAGKIMLPGRCRADLDRLSAHYGVPVVRAAPPPAETREMIKTGGFDAVCFTSSSTVRNLVGIAGKPHARTIVACIGPKTAETAAEFGLRVDVQPETAAVGPLVDALAEHAARLRAEGALPPPRKKSRRR